MTKVIVAETKLDCEHLLGKFLDESHYDVLIDEDCDFYAPGLFGQGPSEASVMFKFRKGVFTQEEQDGVYKGLIGAAKKSQNRGIAAGPKGAKDRLRDWVTVWQQEVLDILIEGSIGLDGTDNLLKILNTRHDEGADSSRGLVWLRSKIVKKGEKYEGFFDRWVQTLIPLSSAERSKIAREYAKECISRTTYANQVNSGIAGFFDRFPRYPYGRSCAYNHFYPEKFALSFPYLRKLDKMFSELLPERYAAQKACAETLDPKFRVGGDTVFTTLTVNKTFRTAAHRDAGDLHRGFSNLNVIASGTNFKGGYLVLPEYRAAVNIRPGDLLLINNHEAIHGNTEILPTDDQPFERMSLVAYFRENMMELGSWDYETTRRDFVESRRLDPNHPEWRPGWNGVSPSMFESSEWVEWMEANGHHAMLKEYHPDLVSSKANTLF